MTGNVQLYLTRARAAGAVPWMGAHLVGFGRGVKGGNDLLDAPLAFTRHGAIELGCPKEL